MNTLLTLLRRCKFNEMLGLPNQKIHAARIFGFALFDIIGTLVAGWILSRMMDQSFAFATILLFIFGTVLHFVFCVDTAFVRLLKTIFQYFHNKYSSIVNN